MGRKKKKPIKPWCWYCNREFDDDKILAQHQRAKHFKCPFCHKKLYSGPGLTVHCIQVHKEKLDKIPEALPNRNSVDIDIYGMQGVPEDDLREHERLKRGDDGPTKSQQDNRNQQSTSQSNKPVPHATMGPNPTAMQAAMFHAMNMGGVMPPGFPVPPGMPMPPPGFPIPPPGFPGMLPPHHMPPGMPPIPPPNLTFPPGMIPPPGMTNLPPPPMNFPLPPPPPHPSSGPGMNPHLGQNFIPPPPPMSGVGHLIGIPPPSMGQIFGGHVPPPPPPPPLVSETEVTQDKVEDREKGVRDQTDNNGHKSEQYRSPENVTKNEDKTDTNTSAPVTITRQAVLSSSNNLMSASGDTSDGFIHVPSAKMRIMYPSKDVSIEELRLSLPKYKRISLAESEESQQQEKSV